MFLLAHNLEEPLSTIELNAENYMVKTNPIHHPAIPEKSTPISSAFG
jgi:hypothetical protein